MAVLGVSSGGAIADIAGLGHIPLTIGLVLLFVALRGRVKATGRPRPTQFARPALVIPRIELCPGWSIVTAYLTNGDRVLGLRQNADRAENHQPQ